MGVLRGFLDFFTFVIFICALNILWFGLKLKLLIVSTFSICLDMFVIIKSISFLYFPPGDIHVHFLFSFFLNVFIILKLNYFAKFANLCPFLLIFFPLLKGPMMFCSLVCIFPILQYKQYEGAKLPT